MSTNDPSNQSTVGRITFSPVIVPDKNSPSGYRQILAPAQIPSTVVPLLRFRMKGNRLQQAVSDTGGGRIYWQDVPRVTEDTSDVE